MFFQIELLYFVLMIGGFIALLLWAKLPTGLCLMLSALIGAIGSAIFSGTAFDLRYFIEGTFGYFDTILVITTAMVFMGAMEACGALEYISVVLVKAFRKVPSLLLVAFMIIIMFPAMVTGSSLASAISAGALLAPIMIKWGIPKAKTGAIVAVGSILGMVAPPINVPAMVICDVVDIPFTNFALPLLILTIPLAIVCVLLLGRKYVKPLEKEELEYVVDTSITKELNWTVCIPIFVLILLIIMEMVLPSIFGSLAMTGMFVIATILCFFVGRKLPFWSKKKAAEQAEQPAEEVASEDGEIVAAEKPAKKQEEAADSIVEVLRRGVMKSFSAMGLLMGVGMFMEIITLNGVRGFFVANAISLPSVWKYVGMAVTLPLFGGISAFGSASMLGGPFVMALNGTADNIIVTGGLSLLAAVGEFLPPTAMSATFAANIVEEKGWSRITKAALVPLAVIFVYSLLYTIPYGMFVQSLLADKKNMWYLIVFAIVVVLAVAFAFIWEFVSRRPKMRRYAYDVVSGTYPELEAQQTEEVATEEEVAAEEEVTETEQAEESAEDKKEE